MTNKTKDNQNTGLQLLASGALIVLSVGLILGMLVSQPIQRYTNPELYEAKQQATLSLKVAGAVTYQAISILFIVALFVGFIVAGIIGIRYLDRLSRRTYSQDGLYPLIEVSRGTQYDPNRDNLGAHPALTYESMQVQKQQALKADKLSVNVRNDNATLEALTQEPVIDWPSKIPLRGIVDAPYSINHLALGVTVDDKGNKQVINAAMSDLVHVAVGGSSGWGKSVFLKSLAYQLVNSIEKPLLTLCDLEGVTLGAFEDYSNLLYPMATTEGQAVTLFNALLEEMERRKKLFNQYKGCDKLAKYNAKADTPLKPIIGLVDEATALLSNKQVEEPLKTLVLRARKYGLWLVLAGQDWKASSLDTAIRNQLSTRVQFKALNAAQSNVLIGESAAKELNAVGRALAVLPGRGTIELQTPFVRDSDLIIVGKGAMQQYPEVIDVLPETQLIEDDPDMTTEARVKLLHSQGLSLNAIQQRVFGGVGGNYYYQVKQILGNNG